MRQLHTPVNELSDAKLSEQNLFMLYCRTFTVIHCLQFSIHIIDHDKLLRIMYELGFPTDAIYVTGEFWKNVTQKASFLWAYYSLCISP